ncbi:MAG: hypothetical protein M1818_003533 [Claussenomyces sp. TS43310]|nr:MAG: hypothetical protein M1818_003533 [Claussenomyces sp. TS43310]
MVERKKLGVGIIGAGEVAQVIHIPTLLLLNELYRIVSICDVSPRTAAHVAHAFGISKASTDPEDVMRDAHVDVIFNLTSDEFHAPYTIAALRAGKHVMLEKPLTLSVAAGQAIVEAERAAQGPRVFVGYMRRYAASYTQAFRREVASIPRILYARARDIVGPNAHFVSQSGCPTVRFDDVPVEAAADRRARLDALLREAFPGREVTPARRDFCRFLGSLGSHDLSLVRETLGMPESIGAVAAHEPFYAAILHFRNGGAAGEPFALTYESGIDRVPRFDAHLAVYGEDKTVSITYQTPYVKGLPIVVRVEELDERGEASTREIRSSYEDAYTLELKELHACLTEGKEIKTTAEDALMDLKLFKMMFDKWEESQA